MRKKRKFTIRDARERVLLEERKKAMGMVEQLRTFQTPKQTILKSIVKGTIKIREARAMLKKSFAYKHHGQATKLESCDGL